MNVDFKILSVLQTYGIDFNQSTFVFFAGTGHLVPLGLKNLRNL